MQYSCHQSLRRIGEEKDRDEKVCKEIVAEFLKFGEGINIQTQED
jgi:hypothetical protein